MKRRTMVLTAFLVTWMITLPMSWAQTDKDKEHAELAKALKDVKFPLEKGLSASGREGKPIFPASTRWNTATCSFPSTR